MELSIYKIVFSENFRILNMLVRKTKNIFFNYSFFKVLITQISCYKIKISTLKNIAIIHSVMNIRH